LQEDEWISDVLEREGINLANKDYEQIEEAIRTETRFSQWGLNRKGRKTKAVDGQNWGYDTGTLQNDLLNNVEIVNGEIIRYTNLPYAEEQQQLASAKSPFEEGYLKVSDRGLDEILGAIADGFIAIMVKT
jgi:hypothetical protein